MKKFLVNIVSFGLLIAVSITGVFFMADGTSDPFYKKFTSSRKSSLILGSSRMGQGIIPSVIDKGLEGVKSYNYAFTYNTSPYGPVYLNSIKQKLDTLAKNQVFVLGVDPWVLSNDSEDPNDINMFMEKNSFLGTLSTVNADPNLDYLIHNYSEPYIKILYNRSPLIVEDDGFLRLTIPLSEAHVLSKKDKAIEDYTEKSRTYQFSTLRMDYLKETIIYLKRYGDVYLIRPPVDPGILEVEDELMPNFEEVLNRLSRDMEVPYFDFSGKGDDFEYSDGHHLMPKSANRLSLEVVSRIKQLKS